MNLGTYDITIDFSKLFVHNNTSIYFKERDLNTAKVRAKLTMQGKVIDITGCNILVKIETMSGEKINDTATIIDATNGIIEIDFKSNALIEGTNFFELKIVKGESVKESPKLAYRVLDSIEDTEGIEATNEYPILIQLISDATEALNRANEMQNDLETVITNANEVIDNTNSAKDKALNAVEEVNAAKNSMIEDVNSTKNTVVSDINQAKETMIADTNKAIEKMNNDFEALTASQQQDAEVINARDGEESLNARLKRDLAKGRIVEETKEGTYLSFDNTVEGFVQDIEFCGNTVQDSNNLADIKSSGIANGDGTYQMSILSIGENLFDGKFEYGHYDINNGNPANSTNLRSVNYIRVEPNVKYVFAKDANITGDLWVVEYDKNKQFIGNAFNSVTTKESTKFIKFYIAQTNLNLNSKVKLQEGTVTTPYTPYEETRCDINLPCQLEKWDRLYFDKIENAWCVEKNIGKVQFKNPRLVYNESARSFRQSRITDISNISQPSREPNDVIQISSAMKAISANSASGAKENGICLYIHDSGVNELIVVDSNETDASVINDRINDSWLYYKLKTPRKIVLPKDIQIKLNSSLNKTHIFTISGEVDATVKATVSKSLASTVQTNTNEINNLSDRVADIEGLKESQDFSYETDTGYLVCKDTRNGVVKDMKVYGKSEVVDGNIISVGNGNKIEVSSVKGDGNLFDDKSIKINIFNNGKYISTNNYNIKPSISLPKNDTYCFSFNDGLFKPNDGGVVIWSGNIKSRVVSVNNSFTLMGNENAISFYAGNFGNAPFENLTLDIKIMLNKGDKPKPYTPHKSDKKQLLCKDSDGTWKPVTELRGIDLNNCDIIENGKYTIKLSEKIIDNNLNFIEQTTLSGQKVFITTFSDMRNGSNYDVDLLCDSYKCVSSDELWGANGTMISCGFNNKEIRIKDTSINSVEELKVKLSTKPIKIIVKLENPKVYEVAPFDLESYENETMILFNSGAIAPYASWKITSYLPNFVRNLANQVKQLQEQVYKTNLANFTVALNTLDTKLRLDRLEAPTK